MRIRWTPAAADDLEQISNYLKEHHPNYWKPTIAKLYGGIRSLKDWPQSGRPGREEGTRELLYPPLPYVVTYRVKQETIEILRIYHGARNLT